MEDRYDSDASEHGSSTGGSESSSASGLLSSDLPEYAMVSAKSRPEYIERKILADPRERGRAPVKLVGQLVFKNVQLLREHQRQAESYLVSSQDPPKGIDTTQLARLKSKKRFGMEKSAEEKWRAIYHFLFPDEDVAYVSHYCDDVVEPPEGLDLTELQIFLQREYHRRLRRDYEALWDRYSQPIEDQLRTEHIQIAEQCLDAVFRDFHLQNGNAISLQHRALSSHDRTHLDGSIRTPSDQEHTQRSNGSVPRAQPLAPLGLGPEVSNVSHVALLGSLQTSLSNEAIAPPSLQPQMPVSRSSSSPKDGSNNSSGVLPPSNSFADHLIPPSTMGVHGFNNDFMGHDDQFLVDQRSVQRVHTLGHQSHNPNESPFMGFDASTHQHQAANLDMSVPIEQPMDLESVIQSIDWSQPSSIPLDDRGLPFASFN
ncbi:hypothetical protein K469DRAFT_684614 [Zopfia rhizophila CBS 207.26]|uniref:Uncharacterized protein n=1 Tax=Zopfia rhizophila CBS 207.26 TaxID=1314779 RepID=A0A6A6EBP3_9PEZI|nr:hypothetical protein K469DRAFT_684614 [Zopfia rhizophila CBS 207.26]